MHPTDGPGVFEHPDTPGEYLIEAIYPGILRRLWYRVNDSTMTVEVFAAMSQPFGWM